MNEKEESNEMEVEKSTEIFGAYNANADEAPSGVGTASSGLNVDCSVKGNNSFRVMAPSGTIVSVLINLHLLVMNVSKHWTRLGAQEGSNQLGNFNLK